MDEPRHLHQRRGRGVVAEDLLVGDPVVLPAVDPGVVVLVDLDEADVALIVVVGDVVGAAVAAGVVLDDGDASLVRSEERRVGKESRSRWLTYQ